MVDISLPMDWQITSYPSALYLTPKFGTMVSFQWLTVSFCLCICKAMAGPLRRQLYQSPFSKHFLASTIVSGFWWLYMVSPQVVQSLDSLSFSLCSTLYPHICFCQYFVPLLGRTELPTLWSFFFLSFMWSENCILGIQSFWANIHLSVSAYYLCSFVIGQAHSG